MSFTCVEPRSEEHPPCRIVASEEEAVMENCSGVIATLKQQREKVVAKPQDISRNGEFPDDGQMPFSLEIHRMVLVQNHRHPHVEDAHHGITVWPAQ